MTTEMRAIPTPGVPRWFWKGVGAEPLAELRALAANRDEKRDIAAVTLNMAISAAGGDTVALHDPWWDEFYAVLGGLTLCVSSDDLKG